MGLDVSFLITNADKGEEILFAHTILDIYSEGGSRIWDALEGLDSEVLPKDARFNSYLADSEHEDVDSCYGPVLEDRYGERLRWAFGKEIYDAIEKHRFLHPDEYTRPNVRGSRLNAALEYLRWMPETKVVIYWR